VKKKLKILIKKKITIMVTEKDVKKKNFVAKVAIHIRKYLLVYSLIAIAVGWILGIVTPALSAAHKKLFKSSTIVLVFMMIYPMMINLNINNIPKIIKRPKPVLMSLVYNFVITPIITYLLVKIFIHDPSIALGVFLVMLIPGSSMSIGYTGLAEGNIEIATIALGINFVLIPFLLPVFIHYLGSQYTISVPVKIFFITIIEVLIVPMILGDLTRRVLIKTRGEERFMKLKPLFSIITMVSMFLIVGVIFYMKAELLLEKWKILIVMALITIIYLILMLGIITWLNKRVKLGYGEHMGIVFLSTGKNNGTAIAIAVLAFSPLVAIPAATLPLFQIIFLIGYLYLTKVLKKYFKRKPEGEKNV